MPPGRSDCFWVSADAPDCALLPLAADNSGRPDMKKPSDHNPPSDIWTAVHIWASKVCRASKQVRSFTKRQSDMRDLAKPRLEGRPVKLKVQASDPVQSTLRAGVLVLRTPSREHTALLCGIQIVDGSLPISGRWHACSLFTVYQHAKVGTERSGYETMYGSAEDMRCYAVTAISTDDLVSHKRGSHSAIRRPLAIAPDT